MQEELAKYPQVCHIFINRVCLLAVMTIFSKYSFYVADHTGMLSDGLVHPIGGAPRLASGHPFQASSDFAEAHFVLYERRVE